MLGEISADLADALGPGNTGNPRAQREYLLDVHTRTAAMAAKGRRAKKTRTLCARGRPTIRICFSLEPRRRGLFLTIAAGLRVHSFPDLPRPRNSGPFTRPEHRGILHAAFRAPFDRAPALAQPV